MTGGPFGPLRRPSPWFWSGVFLLAVAAAQVFVAGAGLLNSDTKLFLQTDPLGLMAVSRSVWDPFQYGGYVAHQAVGYLWPMGPFFAAAKAFGIPIWLVQRLWLMALFALGSIGAARFVKEQGQSVLACTLAGFAYQLSPYVLSYQSRTSAMLLPWAGLGWLCVAVMRGIRTSGWRWPAAVSLLLLTIGGVNATALLLVLPAPAILVLDALVRRPSARVKILMFVAKSTVLGILVSLWWLVMVAIQASTGSEVLYFSETLEAVSSTSNAFEVLRGFGYWLNYVGMDGSFPLTSAAARSMASLPATISSLIVPLSGLAGIVVLRRDARRVAGLFVFVGLVLAIGVHPIENPVPLWRSFAADPQSSAALSLRSSTRAIPVLLLGLVWGLAAAFDGVASWRRTRVDQGLPAAGPARFASARHLALLIGIGIVCAVPSRMTDGVVEPSLDRTATIDSSWEELGNRLDQSSDANSRVLQLPGQDFGAYTWGYTLDPALAAVTSRPILIRELLPLGSPQMMNLLVAVNDAVLEGRMTAPRLIEIGRRFGVSDVVLPGDLDLGRYKSPSQQQLISVNSWTDQFSSSETVGKHLLVPIGEGSVLRSSVGTVTIFGDGEGLVAAAGWGLLGRGVTRYVADMSDPELRETLEDSSVVVITDSNQLRATHWRSTRDTVGYGEDGTVVTSSLIEDRGDRRLETFRRVRLEDSTRYAQRGSVTARASAYGALDRYLPEQRPYAAVDGELSTAWTLQADVDAEGKQLQLEADRNVDTLTVVQLQKSSSRRIVTIGLSVDEGRWKTFSLDESSATTVGQTIALPRAGRNVRLRIEALGDSDPAAKSSEIGLAEAYLGLGRTEEVGVLPSRGISEVPDQTPAVVVLSRRLAPPWDQQRSDPESRIIREVTFPDSRSYRITGLIGQEDDSRMNDDTRVNTDSAIGEPPTIRLDGRSIAVTTRQRSDGRWLFESVSPVEVAGGVHRLESDGPVEVDELLLIDVRLNVGALTDDLETLPRVTVDAALSSKTGSIGPCSVPCWLVDDQGFNDEWELSLDGSIIGSPTIVDGGGNGWLLPASESARTFEITFRPQSIATIAQLMSLFSALLCLILFVFGGSRENSEPDRRESRPNGPVSVRRKRTEVMLRIVLFSAVLSLTAAPTWVAVALVAVAGCVGLGRSTMIPIVGMALVTSSFGLVIARLVFADVRLSFSWPQISEFVHGPLIIGVALVTLGWMLVPTSSSSGEIVG